MKSFPNEFTHRAAPENHLIVESICRYCNLEIGASWKAEFLELLEGIHSCRERTASHDETIVKLKSDIAA